MVGGSSPVTRLGFLAVVVPGVRSLSTACSTPIAHFERSWLKK